MPELVKQPINPEVLTPELTLVHRYCSTIARSNDPEEIMGVQGTLDFFHQQTETSGTSESYSHHLASYMRNYLNRPTDSGAALVQNWRCYTLSHSLRALVQGRQIPDSNVEDYAEIILSYFDEINGTDFESDYRKPRDKIVDEMNQVISYCDWIPSKKDKQITRRAYNVLSLAQPSRLTRVQKLASFGLRAILGRP
jgi:hypothetical protein